MRKVVIENEQIKVLGDEEAQEFIRKQEELINQKAEDNVITLGPVRQNYRLEKPELFKTIYKAYLLTDEPVYNLEKVEEGKYLIKELTIDEYLNHRYIRKLIRQYENRPNLWERIFGF